MGENAHWALQQGVYQALSGDNTITGLLGGPNIYDDVPQDADFPYLTVGESRARDWSTGTEDGLEHVLTFHVWSRAGGRKETHAIMSAIHGVLDDAPLAVADHHLINMRHEFSDARRDPDGITYHGLIRFRAVTEPVS